MGQRVYGKARFCLRLLGAAALVLGAAFSAYAGDEDRITIGDYEIGRGLPLGETGFTLGGYATVKYEDTIGNDPSLSLDHLSFMLWWEGDSRFKFFAEADLERNAKSRQANADNEQFLSLERAYLDYAVSDDLTLRGGKFLTPIGRWNLIHADPLVWTTSRPMVTDQVFPSSTTGVMALGTVPVLSRDVDYMVYVAGSHEWRAKPDEDPFSEARGLHFNVPVISGLQMGLSFSSFEQESNNNDHKHLSGFDFSWSERRWEVSGEAVYRSSSQGADQAERGGYLQVVAPLGERLYAVGRSELFRFAGEEDSARAWIAGLNYRYARGVSLKAEVVRGHHLPSGEPDGFLASISVLF